MTSNNKFHEKLIQLDNAVRLLHVDGHVDAANRCACEIVKTRRRIERALAGMAARRVAGDAHIAGLLGDAIKTLEMRLAARQGGA